MRRRGFFFIRIVFLQRVKKFLNLMLIYGGGWMVSAETMCIYGTHSTHRVCDETGQVTHNWTHSARFYRLR